VLLSPSSTLDQNQNQIENLLTMMKVLCFLIAAAVSHASPQATVTNKGSYSSFSSSEHYAL